MNDGRETNEATEAEHSEAETTCRSISCGAPVEEHDELCRACWAEKYGDERDAEYGR